MRFVSRDCKPKAGKEVVLLLSFLRGFGFGRVELVYSCEEEGMQGMCMQHLKTNYHQIVASRYQLYSNNN